MIKLKTAKEICRELQNKDLLLLIQIIVNNNGVYENFPHALTDNKYGYKYYTKHVVHHNSLLSETNLSALKKLGYTVEKKEAELSVDLIEKFKTVQRFTKFLGFVTGIEEVQEHDGYTPVMSKFTWYKISACCENNDNNK